MTSSTLPAAPPSPMPAPPHRNRLIRLTRGHPEDPAWVRPALLLLLGATALLYLAGLGASGWANSFYSAAVQAGATSWKAFFFGSSDAANSIMVDKPPAALWVMELSARVFGVNSWSILVPQALEGVTAVGVLYATVRRWHGPGAGLLAGTVLALTPVAVLMFRFNNPDALLVLILVLAAYATVRALEHADTGWLVLAAGCVGLGFLTKMLQAFLVVPAFALVYLLVAPTRLRRRAGQLLAAGAALIVSSGWWVAIVDLWPAADRPYVGGSQTNSVLELIFGYNGFGRLTGDETGSVGGPFRGGPAGGAFGGGPAGGFGGGPGGGGMFGGNVSKLFDSAMDSQISWLLPAAAFLGLALLWITRRAGRTDRLRASVLLWGGWLLVTAVVFSLAEGIIHPYYTVALAPAIGALIGIGAVEFWRLRDAVAARAVQAVALAGSAVWAWVLLAGTPEFLPWLRYVVLAGGLLTAVVLLAGRWLRGRLGLVVAGVALVLGLAAPAAYALDTVATAHTGAIPSAGPSAAFGPGGGGPGRFARFGAPNHRFPRGFPNGRFPGFRPNAGLPGFGPNGGFPGAGPLRGGPSRNGGMGGLLDGGTPSAEITALLQRDASRYTWVAATIGSNPASGYQLATGDPVMPIGGFNGSDPSPTLAQFQRYVAQGKIHYFIGGGGGFGRQNGGSSAARDIAAWVQQSYRPTTVGGTTVYDLTAPPA